MNYFVHSNSYKVQFPLIVDNSMLSLFSLLNLVTVELVSEVFYELLLLVINTLRKIFCSRPLCLALYN